MARTAVFDAGKNDNLSLHNAAYHHLAAFQKANPFIVWNENPTDSHITVEPRYNEPVGTG